MRTSEKTVNSTRWMKKIFLTIASASLPLFSLQSASASILTRLAWDNTSNAATYTVLRNGAPFGTSTSAFLDVRADEGDVFTVYAVSPAGLAGPRSTIAFQSTDLGSTDSDDDGVPNDLDNCPSVSNPDQEALNGTTAGDACRDLSMPAVFDADGDKRMDSYALHGSSVSIGLSSSDEKSTRSVMSVSLPGRPLDIAAAGPKVLIFTKRGAGGKILASKIQFEGRGSQLGTRIIPLGSFGRDEIVLPACLGPSKATLPKITRGKLSRPAQAPVVKTPRGLSVDPRAAVTCSLSKGKRIITAVISTADATTIQSYDLSGKALGDPLHIAPLALPGRAALVAGFQPGTGRQLFAFAQREKITVSDGVHSQAIDSPSPIGRTPLQIGLDGANVIQMFAAGASSVYRWTIFGVSAREISLDSETRLN